MEDQPAPLNMPDRQAWRDWLQANHTRVRETWLYIYKKGAADKGIGLGEAVEEALCFGWIDGAMHGVDEEKFALRFSPRRKNSVWSISNIDRVERLILEGKMTPAGLRVVEQAKDSGTWQEAIQREDTEALPTDLMEALATDEIAEHHFDALSASHKKRYLWWLADAKRSETRQRRIAEIVKRMAETS